MLGQWVICLCAAQLLGDHKVHMFASNPTRSYFYHSDCTHFRCPTYSSVGSWFPVSCREHCGNTSASPRWLTMDSRDILWKGLVSDSSSFTASSVRQKKDKDVRTNSRTLGWSVAPVQILLLNHQPLDTELDVVFLSMRRKPFHKDCFVWPLWLFPPSNFLPPKCAVVAFSPGFTASVYVFTSILHLQTQSMVLQITVKSNSLHR